jgi:hypothetical protein
MGCQTYCNTESSLKGAAAVSYGIDLTPWVGYPSMTWTEPLPKAG